MKKTFFDSLKLPQGCKPCGSVAMGRMTADAAQNHKLIYNSFGLVEEVQQDNGGSYIPLVKYFYDENGQRLQKTSYNSSGTAVERHWYVGGVKYQEDLLASTTNIEYDLNGTSRLGKFERTGSLRTYELSDHLGNVRATVSKNSNGNLTLLSYADYYPFGSEMPGRQFVSGDEYNHKYQGQFTEHEEEVNWEAFELRNWDGRLARWTTTDPYGQYWSPYLGMGNNPMNGVDPDGGFNGWVTNADGETFWDSNTNSLAEFNTNYAGLSGFSYASDLSDFRVFNLPDGSGVLTMINYEEVIDNHWNLYGVSLTMEYTPTNGNGAGWVQTLNSNSSIGINQGNFKNQSLYSINPVELIDGLPDNVDATNLANSDFYSRGNRFFDALGRSPLDSRNINVVWDAQVSFITGKNNRAISLSYGFKINPSGVPKFNRPTILNKFSNFHRSAIKNLPE